MRRNLSGLLIATVATVVAACGGGDGDDPSAETTASIATTTTVATSTGSSAPDVAPPATPEGCETTPVAADYPEGETPPAIRPCEVPEALVISTIREGTGRNAEDGDTLIVDYVGMRSEDGTVFDESYTRGVPFNFPLGRGGVIQGWNDGLLGTQAGALVRLDVPAELAYGPNPPGGEDAPIEPNDALSFVIDVRSIIPAVTADDAPLDLQIDPSVGATEVSVQQIVAGDGAVAELGDTVVVHLLLVRGDNQVVLFNTWENSDPLQIVMAEGETLPGLFQALQGARVGSTLVVAMPPEEAFGPDGNSQLGLPAGTDLVVVVELAGVY